jgi:hypothetical protein
MVGKGFERSEMGRMRTKRKYREEVQGRSTEKK